MFLEVRTEKIEYLGLCFREDLWEVPLWCCAIWLPKRFEHVAMWLPGWFLSGHNLKHANLYKISQTFLQSCLYVPNWHQLKQKDDHFTLKFHVVFISVCFIHGHSRLSAWTSGPSARGSTYNIPSVIHFSCQLLMPLVQPPAPIKPRVHIPAKGCSWCLHLEMFSRLSFQQNVIDM